MKKADIVRGLLGTGLSYSSIAREAGCSKSTVHYHAKRAGQEVRTLTKYDWSEIQKYYDANQHSMGATLKHFGVTDSTWYKAIKRGDLVLPTKEEAAVELLGRVKSRTAIKRCIKILGVPQVCNICGISSWLEKPLSLQLDHINGVNNDNRLENLQLLCANCHSQTPTYGGRNSKR